MVTYAVYIFCPSPQTSLDIEKRLQDNYLMISLGGRHWRCRPLML